LKSEMAESKKETKDDIAGIQSEIRKIGDVLTKQAAAETRLDGIDTRLNGLERDIRELRHGEGFVRGQFGRTVDKEYL
jgi:ABC-type hemin transport system substrate-binding protein